MDDSISPSDIEDSQEESQVSGDPSTTKTSTSGNTEQTRKPPVQQQEYKQQAPDIKSTDSTEIAAIKASTSVLNNITGGVVAVNQAKEAGKTDRLNSSAEAIASMTNNTVKELSRMATLNKHTVLNFGPASVTVSSTDNDIISDLSQLRRVF